MKVLDASWYMPGEQRNQLQEYQVAHIPGALFFDVDGISDRTTNLPHMLPSEEAFAAAVSALGIENKDGVVAYDGKGIFSAARVWWLVRLMVVLNFDLVFKFDGVAAEPRKGIKCGHVRGSKCIPFAQMLDSSQALLSVDQLKKKFEQEGKLVNFTFLLSVLMNS
ncbi:hypothetical protein L1887_23482 [Cichorium endivia]|nr:hypothetical protein L1887_23482 [Cichorium endivia]